MSTIGQYNSAVFQSLGQPDKSVCDFADIHMGVRHALTFLTVAVRQSDNNQTLEKTSEFTPTASLYNITLLLSPKATPAFVEVKRGARWEPVRVVNKAFLEEYYQRGADAVSFYASEPTSVTPGVQYIEFAQPVSSDSSTVYRIWYDKDAVETSLFGTAVNGTLLPDQFSPLVEAKAQVWIIPRITKRLSEAIESEEQRKLHTLQIGQWDKMLVALVEDVAEWMPLFKVWKNRNRTAQNQSRLPTVSSRGLYGG